MGATPSKAKSLFRLLNLWLDVIWPWFMLWVTATNALSVGGYARLGYDWTSLLMFGLTWLMAAFTGKAFAERIEYKRWLAQSCEE